MTYEEVLAQARSVSTKCRVCPECNGLACRGMVPGPGGKGSGKSFASSLEYFKNVDIMLDPLYDNSAGQELSCDFFGVRLSMPVMGAPCGGAALNFGVDPAVMDDHAFVTGQVAGARQAGTLGWIPDGPKAMGIKNTLDIAVSLGGMAVPTIKPWKNAVIMELMDEAERCSVPAIACDIDSAGLINLKLMGTPVDPKSFDDVKELAEHTKLPFIVKGVVTVKAAEAAARAGAAGIVVSNHGGRILQDAPSAISMLPEIRTALGNGIKLFVDGGIRSGSDVYKAIALGADAVLIGRPVCHAALGGGIEGVGLYFEKIKDELVDNMRMTGCNTIADITADKIRNRN